MSSAKSVLQCCGALLLFMVSTHIASSLGMSGPSSIQGRFMQVMISMSRSDEVAVRFTTSDQFSAQTDEGPTV